MNDHQKFLVVRQQDEVLHHLITSLQTLKRALGEEA